APMRASAEIDSRLRTGELALAIEIPPDFCRDVKRGRGAAIGGWVGRGLALAIEIPPDFGRDVKRGRAPEIGVWVDGAMPFRGETIRGYVQGVHQDYLARLAVDGT